MSTASKTEYETYNVKVPKSLSRVFELRRKLEHRSKSEAIREAIRVWAIPSFNPTKEELKAFENGRIEFEKGEYISLSEAL